jgi:hypothetical protein
LQQEDNLVAVIEYFQKSESSMLKIKDLQLEKIKQAVSGLRQLKSRRDK